MPNELKYILDHIIYLAKQRGYLLKKVESSDTIFISFICELNSKKTAALLENDIIAAALNKVDEKRYLNPYLYGALYSSYDDTLNVYLSVSPVVQLDEYSEENSQVYIEIVKA